VRSMQKCTSPVIPFNVMCKVLSLREDEYSWEPAAVTLLNRVVEDHVVGLLDKSVLCAVHAGRTVVTVEDVSLTATPLPPPLIFTRPTQ
jgi:histone H3/H4